MAPRFPSIPDPTADPQSLRDAVLALKQAFEMMAGTRGNVASATAEDLASASETIATNTSDIETLQTDAETLQTDVGTLQTDVGTLQTDVETLDATTTAFSACGRLSYVSTTQIKLSPFNGSDIVINGQVVSIPSAGVTASNSGLSSSTLYYVYAYLNSGTLTLELSTTTHATDTAAGNVGVEIKSGDPTRSLVGAIRTTSGSLFADSATQRFVRSWFNRKSAQIQSAALGASASMNGSLTEATTSLRTEFVAWGDETLLISSALAYFNNTTGAVINTEFNLDGSTSLGAVAINGDGSGRVLPLSAFGAYVPSEGYHYLTVFTSLSSGTASVYSSSKYGALLA